ncbi:hypothetical protein [Halobacillus aidingensis]|nr:hypothetical protein [Halobacillus aidingensis]
MRRKYERRSVLPRVTRDKDAPIVIDTKNGRRTAAYKKSGGCCGKRR